MTELVSVKREREPFKGRWHEVFYIGDGSLMRASLTGPYRDPDAGRGYMWRLTVAEGDDPSRWRAWQGFVGTATQRTDKFARDLALKEIEDAVGRDQDAIAVARRALEEAAK